MQWSNVYAVQTETCEARSVHLVPNKGVEKISELVCKERMFVDGTPQEFDELETLKELDGTIKTYMKLPISIEKLPEAFTIDRAVNMLSRMKVELNSASAKITPTVGNENPCDVDEMKSKTKCRTCDLPGHWWKNCAECRRIIEERKGDSGGTTDTFV